jgi:hypothetical protein
MVEPRPNSSAIAARARARPVQNNSACHLAAMSSSSREPETGSMTLANALAAGVRLVVWCKACGHQTVPAARRCSSLFDRSLVRRVEARPLQVIAAGDSVGNRRRKPMENCETVLSRHPS